MSSFYEPREDRVIMLARETRVEDVQVAPWFVMRLTNGVALESTALPQKKASPHRLAPTTSFGELPGQQVSQLVGTRPLAWVIFDNGHHLFVFSNVWHAVLRPESHDTWRVDIPGETPFMYPLMFPEQN